MRSFAILLFPLALLACSESGAEAEDGPANRMVGDDVTEVQDESATEDVENSDGTNETDGD